MQKALIRLFPLINLAIRRGQTQTSVPYSKGVYAVLRILRAEGFIGNFYVGKMHITIFFNYYSKRPVLKQILPISTPGRKVYSTFGGLKFLLSKYSAGQTTLIILRSPAGVYSHKEAERSGVGGEPICVVYS
jgi:ribosomal protein S8